MAWDGYQWGFVLFFYFCWFNAGNAGTKCNKQLVTNKHKSNYWLERQNGRHFRCKATPTLDRIFKNALPITKARQGSHYSLYKFIEKYPWNAVAKHTRQRVISPPLKQTPLKLRLGPDKVVHAVGNTILSLSKRERSLTSCQQCQCGSNSGMGRASRLTG